MPAAVRTLVEQSFATAKAQPDNAEATVRLGMALQAHGQTAAAERCYARAHALDPKRYDALYYWSQTLSTRGDHKAAAQKLRDALAVRPEYKPARLALAQELREAGDNDGSAAEARKLGDDPIGHYLIGRATNSEDELRKAIEQFPRYGAAQFALATLYRRNGKANLAAQILKDYERDKTVTPPVDDPEAAALTAISISPAGLLRRSLQEEAAGRLPEAAALQHQALAMQPDLVDAWVNLISLNARMGRDAEVEEAYRKAASLAPDRAETHYNFGVYCLQKNRVEEAKQAFQKALVASPRHAESALNLAGILAQEGRMDDAIRYLQKAIDAKPSFAQAHYEKARILAYLRRIPQAITEYEQAVALAKANANVNLASAAERELRELRK